MPGRLRDPGPGAGDRLADALGDDGAEVAELRRRAAELDIPGRSRMSKNELTRAVRVAGGARPDDATAGEGAGQ